MELIQFNECESTDQLGREYEPVALDQANPCGLKTSDLVHYSVPSIVRRNVNITRV